MMGNRVIGRRVEGWKVEGSDQPARPAKLLTFNSLEQPATPYGQLTNE